MNRGEPLVELAWLEPGRVEKGKVIEALPVTIGRGRQANSIELHSRFVSGQHARLEWRDSQIVIVDLGSKNGTYVNGRRIDEATTLSPGSYFQIGPFAFTMELVSDHKVEGHSSQIAALQPDVTSVYASAVTHPHSQPFLAFSPFTDVLMPNIRPGDVQGDPLPTVFEQQRVPMRELAQVTPVETTTYLTVGGGVGSFTWVDYLVISGVDPSHIVAIGLEYKPYGRYQRLCRNSQISGQARLRSNSDSCPDNIWGWPGYAVREMWRELTRGRIRKVFSIGWQIFNEPFVQPYTPIAQDVYDAIDREAQRIGWDQIWRQGRVRAIRKTDDGRYAVAYSHINPDQVSQQRIIVCRYLHLAVGYPGVRFLPDLQTYRQQTGDFERVVNAYEDHDHIYDNLKTNGGVVLIRGRGIVASRIIQRICDMRSQSNTPIGILHLMRSPLAKGSRYKRAQRPINNHWEFQPYNWPKAAWGGDLRIVLEKADDDGRELLLDAWGGTTTADREEWREMIERGLREGWYEIQFGNVRQVAFHATGRIATVIRGTTVVAREITLLTDYIIDATGLESDIDSSPLLQDMVTHYALPRNPKGGLGVTNEFEIETLRNEDGRVYASGISTLGGPYAPVDSFLGLQYAAMRSVDSLRTRCAPGVRRLNFMRSLWQWVRWAIGVKP
jgi:pSer/pThr/pTyr-binding forkhead associated (FHA) protein